MCFILMDMRHPPNENDLKMLEWVKYYGFDFTIVLTKVDKLKMGERIKMRKVFKDVLSKYGEYYTVEFSAMTGEGLSNLLDILSLITGDKS
ncbi:MAG: YihA family ribosome biogenesis GTP-binding protein, partial [Thermotoga sp.]